MSSSPAVPADAAESPTFETALAELEQKVQTIASNEQSRRQNAERIVLSLELSNLKRALDRGQGHGYAPLKSGNEVGQRAKRRIAAGCGTLRRARAQSLRGHAFQRGRARLGGHQALTFQAGGHLPNLARHRQIAALRLVLGYAAAR